MAIQFACSWCKATYTVDDRHAGKTTKCAKCGEQVQVPDVPPSQSNVSHPAPSPPEMPVRLAADQVEDGPSRSASRDRGRDRDRDYDHDYDDRPRRGHRRTRSQEEDDFDDNYSPVPPRRPPTPGYGLAVTSLILGISGVVVDLASGGPILCTMCCWFLAPLSWGVSGLGGVLGLVAMVLGFSARKAGNRSGMSTGGIVTGGIALALAALGIVLTIAFPAAFLANAPKVAPIQPNQFPPIQQIPIRPLENEKDFQPPAGAPAGTRATKIVGFPGGQDFVDAGPSGTVLVGFEFGLGKFANDDVISSVRPMYRRNNKDDFGARIGGKADRAIKIVAKPGYAVGGISVRRTVVLGKVSVTFMKIKDGKLDPNDSYDSEWVGNQDSPTADTVSSNGALVVGIVGKTNHGDVTGLGLLMRK